MNALIAIESPSYPSHLPYLYSFLTPFPLRLHRMAESSATRTGRPVGTLFMGDFNSSPGSALYEFLDRGHLHFGSRERRHLSGGRAYCYLL